MTSLDLVYSSGILFHLEVAARLVLAALLAGLLGWDREEKARPAGLRTYMLVALAAAVFTLITFEIYESIDTSSTGEVNADPIRIIEAVTAGVAFLAAGAIIQGRHSVRGLTTGAGMWMAGAIGVASGTGNYVLALMAALLAFGILKLAHVMQPESDKPLIIEGEDKPSNGSPP